MPGLIHRHLHGRDDSVASERRAEPRHARIGVGSLRGVGHHHLDVRCRAIQPVVELFVGAVDVGLHASGGLLRLGGFSTGPLVIQSTAMVVSQVAGDRKKVRLVRVGSQGNVEDETRRGNLVGCRGRLQTAAANHIVEPAIAERDGAVGGRLFQKVAPALALLPAHLKDVREIGPKLDGERHLDAIETVIGNMQLLVLGALPEKAAAGDVQAAAGYERSVLEVHVGIGEVHGQERIVVPHS